MRFLKISNKFRQVLFNNKIISTCLENNLCKKHICLLLYGKKIINIYKNINRTYINRKNYPSMHAEHNMVNSIKRIKFNKRKSLTVVSLSFSKNNIRNSEPCSHCLNLLQIAGFSKILCCNLTIDLLKIDTLLSYNCNNYNTLEQSTGFKYYNRNKFYN